MEATQADSFRSDVQGWLEVNFPKRLAGADGQKYQLDAAYSAADSDFQQWRVRVGEKGWGVPTWPELYGGAGLEERGAEIITEELARIGAFNPIRSFGTSMLGPTLLEFGTEDQKCQHLPAISMHAVRWCQGFSEPGAGSDLAALSTRCVDAGDHWLVTGQKIWTSRADEADWCFALVRTDTARKQGGISFLLIDMRSPGIDIRPIILINGTSHFCEVFFTDVQVPKDNIVGGINQGWSVAKRLLQYERGGLSAGRGEPPSLLGPAREYLGVDAGGRLADPDLRGRLIRYEMKQKAYQLTLERIRAETEAGEGPGAAVTAMKNLWSDVAQERAELLSEIMGARGLGWSGDAYADAERSATRDWLYSRCYSIYGGSHEVQANITAKRVLGLPDHP